MVELILGIGAFILLVLLIRWIGAWMLRIDEVITVLKEIKDKL